MDNWKTVEDAKEMMCAVLKGFECEADKCGHWLWRPCLFCNGNGYITRVDKTCGVKQLDECGWCNGTGHDGSGLGRCGLIRG